MMKHVLLWAGLGSLLGVTSPALARDDSGLPESSPCPGQRWVGLADGPFCPAPGTVPGEEGVWHGGWLFADDEAQHAALPEGLKSYCVYEWQPLRSASPSSRALTALPDLVGPMQAGAEPVRWSSWLARDCQIIVPLGGASPLAGLVSRAYAAQLDPVAPLPRARDGWPTFVRVAVVDSSPRAEGSITSPGRFEHGFAITKLIENVACPLAEAHCITYPSTHLALPLVYEPTTRSIVSDPRRGGYFGTHAHLAQAIHEAVVAWTGPDSAMPPPRYQSRLVMNLSLGWDPAYQDTGWHPDVPLDRRVGCPWGDMTPAACAVRAAIVHAVCKGALVVAAAGNHPGGEQRSRGPMLPAAWETDAAPNRADCIAFEDGGSGQRSDYERYIGYLEEAGRPIFPSEIAQGVVLRPLLYAAGGLDGADRPLLNGRPGARPPLAAPGAFAGGILDEDPSAPTLRQRLSGTMAFTGSSMAAAAVSAAATLVWGYAPQLMPVDVMDLLYGTAMPLDARADFCVGGGDCSHLEVRRISLCAAVRAVCDMVGCEPFDCEVREPHRDLRPTATPWCAAELKEHFGVEFPGSATLVTVTDAIGIRTEPWDQGRANVALEPWVCPQPGRGPCPDCALGARGEHSATLFVRIDPGLQVPVDATGLQVSTATGGVSYALSHPALRGLVAGDVLQVHLADIAMDPAWSIDNAELSFDIASTPVSGAPAAVLRQEVLVLP